MIAKETKRSLRELRKKIEEILKDKEPDVVLKETIKRQSIAVTLFLDKEDKVLEETLHEVFPKIHFKYYEFNQINKTVCISYLNVVILSTEDKKKNFCNTIKEFYKNNPDDGKKIFIFSGDKTEIIDNNFIQFEKVNLIPVLEAYLTFFIEPFIAKGTLIEKDSLCDFDEDCLSCSEFTGIERRKCRKWKNYERYGQCRRYLRPPERIIRPYFSDNDDNIFVKGFEHTRQNRAARVAIGNLFFSRNRFDPDEVLQSILTYQENMKLYTDKLCEVLQTCQNIATSFFTIDSIFLNHEESHCYTWFNDQNLIEILINSYKVIKNPDNRIKISRLLVVDFDKFSNIDSIVEQLIIFYIVNHALGVELYICDKKYIQKDIQEYDLNFFLKSTFCQSTNTIKNSEILGILDLKFPFIRVFLKERSKLHEFYILCIEKVINAKVFEIISKKQDCFHLNDELLEFKKLIDNVTGEIFEYQKIFDELVSCKEDEKKEKINQLRSLNLLSTTSFIDKINKNDDDDSIKEYIRKFLDTKVRLQETTEEKTIEVFKDIHFVKQLFKADTNNNESIENLLKIKYIRLYGVDAEKIRQNILKILNDKNFSCSLKKNLQNLDNFEDLEIKIKQILNA